MDTGIGIRASEPEGRNHARLVCTAHPHVDMQIADMVMRCRRYWVVGSMGWPSQDTHRTRVTRPGRVRGNRDRDGDEHGAHPGGIARMMMIIIIIVADGITGSGACLDRARAPRVFKFVLSRRRTLQCAHAGSRIVWEHASPAYDGTRRSTNEMLGSSSLLRVLCGWGVPDRKNKGRQGRVPSSGCDPSAGDDERCLRPVQPECARPTRVACASSSTSCASTGRDRASPAISAVLTADRRGCRR